MSLKNLFVLLFLGVFTQGFTQSKPQLATKIEQLSKRVLKTIHSEDVFLNTGKSSVSTADYSAIKRIVMGNGFPTISMVGKENSHKFWMMVQLCDFDIQFQVAVLKQMGRADRKGDILKEDYAMLTDRTRVNRKIPQLYGTQYVMNDFGDVTLYPIHDESHVNDRRKSLNLVKLSDSEEKVKKTIVQSQKSQANQGSNKFNDRID